MEYIDQFSPYLGQEEIDSVVETLKNNWITEGPKTARMKEMLCQLTGARHAIMLPNGTLALYVALMVNGIGHGDEVIVSDFTFVGSATSICLTGATPVFAEVRRDDFNIDVTLLERYLSPKTKAIMPVHLYGQPVDMDPLIDFTRKHNLKIIEDAAQGIGVSYKGQHVGTLGDAGCISFFADKTITTGEGGVILTNSDELADKCMYFKNQGRLNRGSFKHPYVGFNFRITDLQAALGVVQLKRLPMIIAEKKRVEDCYREHLKDLPMVKLPADNNFGTRVPFRINILVENAQKLIGFLSNKGIGVRSFFYPLHKQPCFNETNAKMIGTYANAEWAFECGVSLPSGISLQKKQIMRVCDVIKEFYTPSLLVDTKKRKCCSKAIR